MKAKALYTALETVKEDEALVATFTPTLSTCQGPNASVSASNWGRKASIKRGTGRRRKAKVGDTNSRGSHHVGFNANDVNRWNVLQFQLPAGLSNQRYALCSTA